jgi:hypothetical protein
MAEGEKPKSKRGLPAWELPPVRDYVAKHNGDFVKAKIEWYADQGIFIDEAKAATFEPKTLEECDEIEAENELIRKHGIRLD